MRYRIVFRGPVAPGIVHWLQALIPVLREVPDGVEVDIEITSVAETDPDPGCDEAS